MQQPGRPGTWERVLPECDERDTPPALSGSEMAHLFDYCRALLGQDADAARTARSVLDSPHERLSDGDGLHAWLFGLARSLSLALRAPASHEPSYMPSALIAASSQQTDNDVVRAFGALTGRDREILDLVYRHGVRPADLPAVLLVPAEEAYRCLAVAEEEFISLVSAPEAGHGAGLEGIGTLPLAALPAAESSERRPDDRPDGPPDDRPTRQLDGVTRGRRVVRPALQFVVAAMIPVALVLAGAHYLNARDHPAAASGADVVPGSGASQVNQRAGTRGGSAQPGLNAAPGQSGHPGPVGSPVTMAEPTSSASIPVNAGPAPAAKPAPCPPGTKANFRWHYAANGSPGGWSGTATQACPGSFTMGPHAIGGQLQLTPGTTLQAGYDFTLPGNNKSLTMTVKAAQVSFAVICVSTAVVPSVSTLTVPLRARTYQITGSQWYPSGGQSSSLVYQGSISVPALCGPSGAISLATGGTFTAVLR